MSSIEPGPALFDLGDVTHGFFALRVVDAVFDKVARAPFELSAAG